MKPRWKEFSWVLVLLYWLNFCLTSLSIDSISLRRVLIRSAMGLSERYLVLFHWKVWR